MRCFSRATSRWYIATHVTNLTIAAGLCASVPVIQFERQAPVDRICSIIPARPLDTPSSWLQKMSRLKCKSPVPSDIDIAQACDLKHIDQVAKDLELTPSDYDLHGTSKAKVRTHSHVVQRCMHASAKNVKPFHHNFRGVLWGFSSSLPSWRSWRISLTANMVRLQAVS